MKKFALLVLSCLWLGFWSILAQNNIIPESAEITVKSPIIQWEATNLTITMIKNWSKMNSYNWTILMQITDERWVLLNENEYTLPNRGMYTFLSTDLWTKEFQKWLEIKKEWTFYIEISDLNDISEENILWRQEIKVTKNNWWKSNYNIDILNPTNNSTLSTEKVEIIAQVQELPNSNISIFIDNKLVGSTSSDSAWSIYYTIPNIEIWKHTLKLESSDIEWNILWSSNDIPFMYSPQNSEWFKRIEVNPENWLKVWDLVDINIYTDEMVESVKLSLSDRDENIVMTKESNWLFHQKVFLIWSWEITISIETSSLNNSLSKNYNNIKQIFVWDSPEIDNVKTEIDSGKKSATVSWTTINGIAWSYLINYWINNSSLSWQERTNTESFVFTDVPYDTEIFLTITPYRDNSTKHGAASKTIQFIITKPDTQANTGNVWIWEVINNTPRCTIQNISTRTTKVWDSYYLIRDKVENVSKYIVYSSTNESWSDRVKVYETTDTSYEYPFDHTSKEDQFVYFWIVWVCDDWEELQLTWATKVQVWPAENFFLLVCITLLIYFWIKLFRETEA